VNKVDIRTANARERFQGQLEKMPEKLAQETAAGEVEKADFEKLLTEAIVKAFQAGFDAGSRLCRALQKTHE
jgi:hypothetical protein